MCVSLFLCHCVNENNLFIFYFWKRETGNFAKVISNTILAQCNNKHCQNCLLLFKVKSMPKLVDLPGPYYRFLLAGTLTATAD